MEGENARTLLGKVPGADKKQESQTGVIDVEESEAVMDLLFRHMYKIKIEVFPSVGSPAPISEKATRENFYLALDVQVAADKVRLL